MPLLFQAIGIDAAHSAPTVQVRIVSMRSLLFSALRDGGQNASIRWGSPATQVLMDILGVFVTCAVCAFIFTGAGQMLFSQPVLPHSVVSPIHHVIHAQKTPAAHTEHLHRLSSGQPVMTSLSS